VNSVRPVIWLPNPQAAKENAPPAVSNYFPPPTVAQARRVHRQIPGYRRTPLHGLVSLAKTLNLGGVWVKDEACRLGLGSFKALGGSFAIFRYVHERLGCPDDFTYQDISSTSVREKLGKLVFAAATDGNHGRGVAWATYHLGFKCVIYVHERTVQARIHAIEEQGARVVVVQGTYDDAVRRLNEDAQVNGWQVISDTSWPGYEQIPTWVMQGYSTIFSEAQEQLVAMGMLAPSHVFIQAGVGSLAASAAAYYTNLLGSARPKIVVIEPDQAACLFHSMEIGDGDPHAFPGDLNTVMAGLACGVPSRIAWEVLLQCADVFLKCPDYVAATGMRVFGAPLDGDPPVISGESGAVTLGALMFIMESSELAPVREHLGLDSTSQVLLVNSEHNTDPDRFRQLVWEGGEPVPLAYRRCLAPKSGVP